MNYPYKGEWIEISQEQAVMIREFFINAGYSPNFIDNNWIEVVKQWWLLYRE